MRHGIAFVIVTILAVLLLVPLVWWMIKGYSITETFEIVTGKHNPKQSSPVTTGSRIEIIQ